MLLKNVVCNGKKQNILIKDNKISKIGADALLCKNDEILDCENKAVLPSFANMHTHAAMMFLRGIGEDKDLYSWLNEDIWPREKELTPELVYALSRFSILEMIKTGTTFFSDMYFHVEETVKAVEEMGLRAAISYVGMDLFDKERTLKEKEGMEKLIALPVSDRITKVVGCHSVYTASEEMFTIALDLAEKYDLYTHYHASETEKEVKDCLKEHGCRPVELMYSRGVMGKKTVFAHCVHLSDNEIKLMADTGTAVAHCPVSNMKLGSGRMPWQKYLDSGLLLTIGTDGVSSNNSLSMLSEMKTTALSAKSINNDISAGKTADIYKAATLNGYRAFGINGGEIKEGALADFILVDLNNHFLLPGYNIISDMIYAADSSCITDVFCNGRRVMTDGHVRDEEEIVKEFKKALAVWKK